MADQNPSKWHHPLDDRADDETLIEICLQIVKISVGAALATAIAVWLLR